MSPFRSLGQVSPTKYIDPAAVVRALATVVPGTTTALGVSTALHAEASPTEPLWNDLVSYDPPLAAGRIQADDDRVAVDSELLRACRTGRDDALLLVWVALNLADPRLDEITREVLTDGAGHLRPEMINGSVLVQVLDDRHASNGSSWHDAKATSNILSLLERCGLLVPEKHGKAIIGVESQLPTVHAVQSAVRLIAERMAERGFEAAEGRELDLTLAMGANAWLNLSPSEFRDAFENRTATSTVAPAQTRREAVPEELEELASQLRRRGQVVLQGAPGAGKTYVARRYVEWSTGGRVKESRLRTIVDALPENQRSVTAIADEAMKRGLASVWDIVQFHPGYDYTDFVRALVAQPHTNGVTFVAQHRILSLISAVGHELARRDYDVELVLVLDEINRGDIPNIFGELLYALEYRDQPVVTPYVIDGEASLTVPWNLKVLGTMNTADRSIAVIDYALRRRFVFLDVPTSEAPIIGFEGYDDNAARKAALHLYRQTREALADAPAGLQVGPSYFLAEPDGAATSTQVLAGRFVYEVLPLLNEYAMEGEADVGRVAALSQRLRMRDGTSQREQASDLASYLADPALWSSGGTSAEADENDAPTTAPQEE
ncbi:hypothetical protein AS25_08390 [Kocuria marina]|uniref:ATPase dynein-related AAA domain-containing protein n=1 Tax=Kocuria marina TaxID=223184 RepID=A0A0B0DFX9_9MICC|nr:AAA family ATPase [Kocuria marina]KHE74179.1 hypothetical protein AS25_08390 [Kocuria marina]